MLNIFGMAIGVLYLGFVTIINNNFKMPYMWEFALGMSIGIGFYLIVLVLISYVVAKIIVNSIKGRKKRSKNTGM